MLSQFKKIRLLSAFTKANPDKWMLLEIYLEIPFRSCSINGHTLFRLNQDTNGEIICAITSHQKTVKGNSVKLDAKLTHFRPIFSFYTL